jgi:glucose-1-phosphate cytidylyltransferase
MKVVLLCGGYGTRIRDVSDQLPKPMIAVGNLPILCHIMKNYASWNINEFILCLGYRGSAIKDFFLNFRNNTSDFRLKLNSSSPIEYLENNSRDDWDVTMAETGLNSMTGARIWRIKKYLNPGEDFMLTYGDGLGDIDMDKLLAFHRSHGRILTVTGVRPPGRFGELAHAANGEVTEFNEKPQASGGRISGGFFVCKPELFRYLNDAEDLVFEQQPLRDLVKDKQLMVYEHNGFWQPMDTYRDYQLLNQLYNQGQAPWVRW